MKHIMRFVRATDGATSLELVFAIPLILSVSLGSLDKVRDQAEREVTKVSAVFESLTGTAESGGRNGRGSQNHAH